MDTEPCFHLTETSVIFLFVNYPILCVIKRFSHADYSKYDLVINELQNVARERQELDADESSDIADQEEVELTHDHNVRIFYLFFVFLLLSFAIY